MGRVDPMAMKVEAAHGEECGQVLCWHTRRSGGEQTQQKNRSPGESPGNECSRWNLRSSYF